MKKFIGLFLIIILLAGCAHNKSTVIRLKGEGIKIPVFKNLLPPIEMKKGEATVVRQVSYMTKDDILPEFKSVSIKTEGKTTTIIVN